MLTVNQILDKELLKKLISKKLNWIKHDSLTFSPIVYGIVYLRINHQTYSITNLYKEKDVFGDKEEIGVLKIQKHTDEVKSMLVDSKLVKQNINLKINKITIVNTNTTVTNKTNQNESYSLLDSNAIIFTLEDDYEFAFEKSDIGELIFINRGYNLRDKFNNMLDDFIKSFDDEYTDSYTINFEEIK